MTEFYDQKSLNECDVPPPIPDLNIDPPPKICEDDGSPSKRRMFQEPEYGWKVDGSSKKRGYGAEAMCDPMTTGAIVNDLDHPDRNTIYRYAHALRGCDEAVIDLFHNVVVIDEDQRVTPVPIIWGTQERAVLHLVQPNIRKDTSNVIDRIRLPMMAIHDVSTSLSTERYTYHRALNYSRTPERNNKPGFTASEKYERDTVFGVARGVPIDRAYTLYLWALYVEDMHQLMEQIFGKFSGQLAYIRIRNIGWETVVRLDSSGNNTDYEPGDQHLRVIKAQFNMTALTYIPLPIVRNKAVLKTRVGLSGSLDVPWGSEVLERLDQSVEELKK